MSARFRIWPALIGLLSLAGAAWLTFGGALRGEFLAFDDDVNITLNEHLGSLRSDTLRWAFSNVDYVRRYQPLGWINWSALLTAFGFDAFCFHAANLVVHCLNGWLLWLLLRRFTKMFCSNYDAATTHVLLWLTVAWWLLHPQRVELVAWSSGLLYLTATAWMLLAVLQALEGVMAGTPRRGFGLATIAYGLSLLTYPVWLGGFVLMMALGMAFLLQQGLPARRAFVRTGLLTWPMVVLSIACVVANYWARMHASAEWGELASPNLMTLMLRPAAILGWFILGIFWPTRLTPADDCLVTLSLSSGPMWTSIAALVVTVALVAWLAWKRGAGAWLILAAFVAIELPFTGVSEGTYLLADRYTYAGHLVVAAGLAVMAAQFCRTRAVVGLALTGAVIVGAVRSHALVPVWATTDTVHARILARAEHDEIRQFYFDRWLGSKLGEGDVAMVEAELSKRPASNVPAALTEALPLARSLQIDAGCGGKSSLVARQHRLLARTQNAKGDAVAALAQLRRSAALAPQDWMIQSDLVIMLAMLGHHTEARALLDGIPSTGAPALCHARAARAIAAGKNSAEPE